MTRYNHEVKLEDGVGVHGENLNKDVIHFVRETLISQIKTIKCSSELEDAVNQLVLKWNNPGRVKNHLMEHLISLDSKEKEVATLVLDETEDARSDYNSDNSKEIPIGREEGNSVNQMCSSSSSSQSKEVVSKLNQNDILLLEAPEKASTIVDSNSNAHANLNENETNNGSIIEVSLYLQCPKLQTQF